MQTSSDSSSTGTNGRSRLGKRLGMVGLVLACVVVVDVLLCLALEPFGSHSELVWTDYRATDQIDTLLLGSSYTSYDLDPFVVEEGLSSPTYNLASPGQSVHNMHSALRSAIKNHKLKRVVLCLGYETMAAVPSINSSIMFTQTKSMGEQPADVLTNVGDLLFDEYYFGKLPSLACAFPWGYDHVDLTWDAIRTNIQNRLEGDVHKAGNWYGKATDPDWSYHGKGFACMSRQLPTQYVHNQLYISHTETEFFTGNLNSLRWICELCQQQGIQLYVLGAPHVPSVLSAYGDPYRTNMVQLKSLVEDKGAVFWDFNMVHPDVFDPDYTRYFESSHLNDVGATEFSNVVSDLIERHEGGEDVGSLFYGYDDAGWSAHLASVDYVDSIDYTSEQAGNGTLLTAKVVTGPNTPVVYRYDVLDPATQEWKTVRDYDPDPTYLLRATDGQKTAQVRIYARANNGKQDEPRWIEDTIALGTN